MSVSAGRNHTCGLHEDGSPECWGCEEDDCEHQHGQSTEFPTEDDEGAPLVFAAIEAGGRHTCGLIDDGGRLDRGFLPVCWGSDNYRQVTDTPAYRFLELYAGDEFTCGHKPDGLLYRWGRNLEGQCDLPQPDDVAG